MKLMLLAAGLGTRLRPVTEKYAKPAVPFLNIPLLYYPFSLSEAAGLDALVVNTHHLPDQIARLANSIPGFKGKVRLNHEAEKPLGSGGGVWGARKWLEGESDFLVANGDEVIFPSRPDIVVEMLRRHRAQGALATLFVMRHPDAGAKFGGVWTDASGRIAGFGRQKPEWVPPGHTPLHYVGVAVLSNRVFKYLPEGESNLLYDALAAGIGDGESVYAFEDRCRWFETGNIPDFLEASHRLLQSLGTSEEPPLFKLMTGRFARGQGKHPGLGGLNFTGDEVRVGMSAAVKGFAVIGDGSVLGKGCVLENCVLLPGARVADGAHIIDSIVT